MMMVCPQLSTTELFLDVTLILRCSSTLLRSSRQPKSNKYLLQNSSVSKVLQISQQRTAYFAGSFGSLFALLTIISCKKNSRQTIHSMLRFADLPFVILVVCRVIQLDMQLVEPKQDRKGFPTRGLKGNTAIWLEEKKTRDTELWGCDTSKYWILDNKLYDLTNFVALHPGGSNWLTMTRGQDVTDYFVVHHLNEAKAREVLKKYYVGETKNKVARYSYEEDGLYRTVKRRLLEMMSVEEIQSESSSKMYAFILLALLGTFLGLTAASINVQNPTKWTYVFAAITAYLMISMIGIGHNFVHHKSNYFKYFFVITGFTHNEWQVMHCLSHHLYPNTEIDYEAAALEPIAYFLRNKPENKVYTEPILVFLLLFVQPLNLILKLLVVPALKKKVPEFWYAVPLCVFALFYFVSGSAWEAFKLHIFIYAFFGFAFNRVLFCGHRVGETWTQGAERIQDFGEHTIYSTGDTDVGVTGFLSYLLLGGFNIHTPHHFFPTADMAVLPKILKIIDEVCKEKGIKQVRNTRLSCFASLSKSIIKRKPFSKK